MNTMEPKAGEYSRNSIAEVQVARPSFDPTYNHSSFSEISFINNKPVKSYLPY